MISHYRASGLILAVNLLNLASAVAGDDCGRADYVSHGYAHGTPYSYAVPYFNGSYSAPSPYSYRPLFYSPGPYVAPVASIPVSYSFAGLSHSSSQSSCADSFGLREDLLTILVKGLIDRIPAPSPPAAPPADTSSLEQRVKRLEGKIERIEELLSKKYPEDFKPATGGNLNNNPAPAGAIR